LLGGKSEKCLSRVFYGYDAASRVTSITYTNGGTTIGTLTYGYNANGQRTSIGGTLAAMNLPAAISSATYNANNQLTNWNGTTLSYDANGNMTSDGTNTLTWNARNQLSAFGGTSFSYDSMGRRTLNASGKSFLYDGANAVQELSGSTVTANLLGGPGIDEVFTRTDSAGTREFLRDALGSTVALGNSSGTVQTQYTYEPFGKTTASGSTNTNTFEFTGRENDGTGLYYYRARYYHPTLQRFVSEDPSRFASGDANFYLYAGADPINFNDPFGLDKNPNPFGGGGSGGGGGSDGWGGSGDGPGGGPGSGGPYGGGPTPYGPFGGALDGDVGVCAAQALWKNKTSLGLDIIAIGGQVFFPEATIANIGIGIVGTVVSASGSNHQLAAAGGLAGAAGIQFTALTPVASKYRSRAR
jgi:RHS repeat-associated protein